MLIVAATACCCFLAFSAFLLILSAAAALSSASSTRICPASLDWKELSILFGTIDRIGLGSATTGRDWDDEAVSEADDTAADEGAGSLPHAEIGMGAVEESALPLVPRLVEPNVVDNAVGRSLTPSSFLAVLLPFACKCPGGRADRLYGSDEFDGRRQSGGWQRVEVNCHRSSATSICCPMTARLLQLLCARFLLLLYLLQAPHWRCRQRLGRPRRQSRGGCSWRCCRHTRG